jgi:hypothetical protein
MQNVIQTKCIATALPNGYLIYVVKHKTHTFIYYRLVRDDLSHRNKAFGNSLFSLY